jgi:O-antigen/teichoic acid export membrane protein
VPTQQFCAMVLDERGALTVTSESAVEARAPRGSALLLVSQVGGNLGFFVSVLILARALTTDGRGAVAFATTAVVIVARVAELGVPEASTVFAARRVERRAPLLTNLVLLGMATSAVAVAALAGVTAFTGTPSEVHGRLPVVVALAILVWTLVGGGYSFLLGLGRLREQTAIVVLMPWVYSLALLVVWRADGLTPVRAVALWTGAHAVEALLFLVVGYRAAGFARPEGRLLLESIRFGARAWLGSLARLLNFRVDQILMGLIATSPALGVYAVAVNAADVLLYVPFAVGAALVPAAARAGDGADPRSAALDAFRAVMLVVVPTVALSMVTAPLLLPLLFGGRYQASVVPFLVLAPGALGFAASSVFSSVLLGAHAPGLSSLAALASLAVGIGGDLLLIPPFGATGAALAATIGSAAGGVVALLAFRRRSAFRWRDLVPNVRDGELLRARLAALGRRLTPRGTAG